MCGLEKSCGPDLQCLGLSCKHKVKGIGFPSLLRKFGKVLVSILPSNKNQKSWTHVCLRPQHLIYGCATRPVIVSLHYWQTFLVLLRFSKSGKRTVSDGFVKKSADSDSVSDSRGRHYKLIYTDRRRAQHLSTGGRQMRRRCISQAIVPGRQDATTGQRAVCPTHPPRTHARTWTSDAPP